MTIALSSEADHRSSCSFFFSLLPKNIFQVPSPCSHKTCEVWHMLGSCTEVEISCWVCFSLSQFCKFQVVHQSWLFCHMEPAVSLSSLELSRNCSSGEVSPHGYADYGSPGGEKETGKSKLSPCSQWPHWTPLIPCCTDVNWFSDVWKMPWAGLAVWSPATAITAWCSSFPQRCPRPVSWASLL